MLQRKISKQIENKRLPNRSNLLFINNPFTRTNSAYTIYVAIKKVDTRR